jgi:hypothetical protein
LLIIAVALLLNTMNRLNCYQILGIGGLLLRRGRASRVNVYFVIVRGEVNIILLLNEVERVNCILQLPLLLLLLGYHSSRTATGPNVPGIKHSVPRVTSCVHQLFLAQFVSRRLLLA